MNTPTEQRNRVQQLAKTRPREAAQLARGIAEAWFRVQALSWVARCAPAEASARLLAEASTSSAVCHDSYQQAAVLAWPLRAAIETKQQQAARAMLQSALGRLPQIELYCSRAEAFALIFPAAFPGGPAFSQPLLDALPGLCPPDVHWRTARLYRLVAGTIASQNATAADAFAAAMPHGKARSRVLRDRARGDAWPPRAFFW